jgi:predicted nucleotidyltransferase
MRSMTPMPRRHAPKISDPKLASLLPEIVRRIVDEADPVRIVMFGSHARGEATSDSDLDLLVITEDDQPDRELVLRIRRRLSDLPIAKDVVVASQQRVKDYGHLVGTILRPALREGITLHERR